ncbi:MAG: hypothetical protein WBM04_19010 [Candidatus Korobacteraceae bacterium]
MNFATVEKIANAVLYEGYILYPYRPSSTKNRQRWNFGTLYPRAFAEAQHPAEAYRMSCECLIAGSAEAKLDVRVRFLQLAHRNESAEGTANWEEGVERSADRNDLLVADLVRSPATFELRFEPAAAEPVSNHLTGQLEIQAEAVQDGLFRLHLELTNLSSVDEAAHAERERMLAYSFSSAHVLLGARGGQFVSLLDPPEKFRAAAAGCQNKGVFPVLVGEQGQHDMLLCSPIILYDYPQIAPESAGDFFDGTEMDEMLALRVLTLTDEEKQEMRQGDVHARAILERTETLPAEHLMKVHGAIRGMRRVPNNEEGS